MSKTFGDLWGPVTNQLARQLAEHEMRKTRQVLRRGPRWRKWRESLSARRRQVGDSYVPLGSYPGTWGPLVTHLIGGYHD